MKESVFNTFGTAFQAFTFDRANQADNPSYKFRLQKHKLIIDCKTRFWDNFYDSECQVFDTFLQEDFEDFFLVDLPFILSSLDDVSGAVINQVI